MAETLRDPILGTLVQRSNLEWIGRVWLTPKHEVEVSFRRPSPPVDGFSIASEDLARASAAYVAIRAQEWDFRRNTAQQLLTAHPLAWSNRKMDPPTLGALTRMLVFARVLLYGDGSANLIYHAPTPFARQFILATAQPDVSASVSVIIINHGI